MSLLTLSFFEREREIGLPFAKHDRGGLLFIYLFFWWKWDADILLLFGLRDSKRGHKKSGWKWDADIVLLFKDEIVTADTKMWAAPYKA